MSNTTVAVPTVAPIRRHMLARTVAVAVVRSANTVGVMLRIVRYNVESDATSPNRRGCEARN